MPSCYELAYPNKIVFGLDSVGSLPSELPAGATVLLVAGSHLDGSATLERMMESLAPFNPTHVSGVSAEPPLEDVDKLIEAGRHSRSTCVVAVGGGSVIDAAKAAAAIIPRAGLCADYFSGKLELPGKGLFFAAIPTTAGTGAELTKNSVLTDARSKVKKSLRHPAMTPDLAVVDPALTVACPPRLTAASGLDAFIQAVESYACPKASAPTKALAAAAVRKVFESLERAFKAPDELQARSEMAEASLLSALSFSQTGLGAIHGIAHPVGSLLGVPHGVACAVIMPHVFEWNFPSCEDAYSELASACGLRGARAFLEAASRLSSSLQIPATLSDYGLSRKDFEFIVKNCRSASMSLNPRPMPDADVASLLSKLL